MTPEDLLRDAGLRLPMPDAPVGSYRMVRRLGPTLWVSGHGAFRDGAPLHVGKLGETMSTPDGAAAARDVMLHLLATVRSEAGELSRVAPVKVVVLVNSTPGFDEQHLVANGATEVLLLAFGDERGRPARTAMGVAGLPLGFAVEIEALFEVTSPD